MSTIILAPCLTAYPSASAKISRPSASVVIISIVFPFIAVRISAGLKAVPLGKFSVAGTIAMTFTFGFSWAMAPMAAITEAAPDISLFISPIWSDGFIEIPPESKVMPLPTSAISIVLVFFPRYFNTMNLGGSSLPWATPSSPPIPNAFICLRSKTLISRPCFSATFRASAAIIVGVIKFEGSFTISRARFAASARILPVFMPCCTAALFLRLRSLITSSPISPCSCFFVICRLKVYKPRIAPSVIA